MGQLDAVTFVCSLATDCAVLIGIVSLVRCRVPTKIFVLGSIVLIERNPIMYLIQETLFYGEYMQATIQCLGT